MPLYGDTVLLLLFAKMFSLQLGTKKHRKQSFIIIGAFKLSVHKLEDLKCRKLRLKSVGSLLSELEVY